MNALTEPTIIQALYRASQAGVPIDLIVRGICCLRPGVPGVSREHPRALASSAASSSTAASSASTRTARSVVFASSADWMQRNLFRRVETCFPIEDAGAQGRA